MNGVKGMGAEEYLNHARQLLRKNLNSQALALLDEGVEAYPQNAFLLSYYGALLAIVSKDFQRGIRTSELALKKLAEMGEADAKAHYPAFYLNIGRAYLASGDRKKALLAFRKGLHYDRYDQDLLDEMNALGVRRRPSLTGLKRSHPLNKYIGIILHRLGK